MDEAAIQRITNLSQYLKSSADIILEKNGLVTLDTWTLYEIKEALATIFNGDPTSNFHVIPTATEFDPIVCNIQYLYDILQKIKRLRIFTKMDQILLSEQIIYLHCFRNLSWLELDSIPIGQLKGLSNLRKKLHCLVALNVCTKLCHVLEDCGGDNTHGDEWRSLEVANFSRNNLFSLDNSLSLLSKTKILNLSYCNLIDVSSLKCLLTVTDLNLSHNKITIVPILSQNASDNIQCIDISSNMVVELNGIENLPNLIEVKAQENLLSLYESLHSLKSLSNLRTLRLFGNPVTCDINYKQKILQFLNENLRKAQDLNVDGNLISKYERMKIGKQFISEPGKSFQLLKFLKNNVLEFIKPTSYDPLHRSLNQSLQSITRITPTNQRNQSLTNEVVGNIQFHSDLMANVSRDIRLNNVPSYRNLSPSQSSQLNLSLNASQSSQSLNIFQPSMKKKARKNRTRHISVIEPEVSLTKDSGEGSSNSDVKSFTPSQNYEAKVIESWEVTPVNKSKSRSNRISKVKRNSNDAFSESVKSCSNRSQSKSILSENQAGNFNMNHSKTSFKSSNQKKSTLSESQSESFLVNHSDRLLQEILESHSNNAYANDSSSPKSDKPVINQSSSNQNDSDASKECVDTVSSKQVNFDRKSSVNFSRKSSIKSKGSNKINSAASSNRGSISNVSVSSIEVLSEECVARTVELNCDLDCTAMENLPGDSGMQSSFSSDANQILNLSPKINEQSSRNLEKSSKFADKIHPKMNKKPPNSIENSDDTDEDIKIMDDVCSIAKSRDSGSENSQYSTPKLELSDQYMDCQSLNNEILGEVKPDSEKISQNNAGINLDSKKMSKSNDMLNKIKPDYEISKSNDVSRSSGSVQNILKDKYKKQKISKNDDSYQKHKKLNKSWVSSKLADSGVETDEFGVKKRMNEFSVKKETDEFSAKKGTDKFDAKIDEFGEEKNLRFSRSDEKFAGLDSWIDRGLLRSHTGYAWESWPSKDLPNSFKNDLKFPLCNFNSVDHRLELHCELFLFTRKRETLLGLTKAYIKVDTEDEFVGVFVLSNFRIYLLKIEGCDDFKKIWTSPLQEVMRLVLDLSVKDLNSLYTLYHKQGIGLLSSKYVILLYFSDSKVSSKFMSFILESLEEYDYSLPISETTSKIQSERIRSQLNEIDPSINPSIHLFQFLNILNDNKSSSPALLILTNSHLLLLELDLSWFLPEFCYPCPEDLKVISCKLLSEVSCVRLYSNVYFKVEFTQSVQGKTSSKSRKFIRRKSTSQLMDIRSFDPKFLTSIKDLDPQLSLRSIRSDANFISSNNFKEHENIKKHQTDLDLTSKSHGSKKDQSDLKTTPKQIENTKEHKRVIKSTTPIPTEDIIEHRPDLKSNSKSIQKSSSPVLAHRRTWVEKNRPWIFNVATPWVTQNFITSLKSVCNGEFDFDVIFYRKDLLFAQEMLKK